MKKLTFLFLCVFLLNGCQRSSNLAWENIKTAGNYLNRGISALYRTDEDSKQLSEDEFLGPIDQGYIPLNEKDLNSLTLGEKFARSQISPGSARSPIPSVDKFLSPKGKQSSLFRKLHFDTDDHVVREKQDLVVVSKIANYLKRNQNVYLNVEGHCDERASAGYNMALGAKRANHIRVLLIKQGVDFNRIYTVSHGKEKPLVLGSSKEARKTNRRVEFKVYKK